VRNSKHHFCLKQIGFEAIALVTKKSEGLPEPRKNYFSSYEAAGRKDFEKAVKRSLVNFRMT
jgi:hypothetical protein